MSYEDRCKFCRFYKRKHIGGPPNYGLCDRRGVQLPAYADSRKCEWWQPKIKDLAGVSDENLVYMDHADLVEEVRRLRKKYSDLAHHIGILKNVADEKGQRVGDILIVSYPQELMK